MTTSFKITFRDFALLGTWDSTLCNTPNAKIDEIKWTLTDATEKRLKTQARKMCTDDAMHKARDFAEALGLDRTAARAVELVDQGLSTSTTGDGGHHGMGGKHASSRDSNRQGGNFVYANEEIRLQSNVTIKCVAG